MNFDSKISQWWTRYNVTICCALAGELLIYKTMLPEIAVPFFAGFDTICHMSTWVLFLLGPHPGQSCQDAVPRCMVRAQASC